MRSLLLLIVLVFVGGAVWNAFNSAQNDRHMTAATASVAAPAPASSAPNGPTPQVAASPLEVPKDDGVYGKYAGLAYPQVIADGRALLAIWKSAAKTPPLSDTEVDQLIAALAEASKNLPADATVQKLHDQIDGLYTQRLGIEDDARLAAEKQQLINNFQPRVAYASTAETNFLKNGMDVTVRASGDHKTVLTMSYVLMGRPTVYNMVNDDAIMSLITSLGFRTVIFTDGYDNTWTYDVAKGKFR